jgi:hypothetical protein
VLVFVPQEEEMKKVLQRLGEETVEHIAFRAQMTDQQKSLGVLFDTSLPPKQLPKPASSSFDLLDEEFNTKRAAALSLDRDDTSLSGHAKEQHDDSTAGASAKPQELEAARTRGLSLHSLNPEGDFSGLTDIEGEEYSAV